VLNQLGVCGARLNQRSAERVEEFTVRRAARSVFGDLGSAAGDNILMTLRQLCAL